MTYVGRVHLTACINLTVKENAFVVYLKEYYTSELLFQYSPRFILCNFSVQTHRVYFTTWDKSPWVLVSISQCFELIFNHHISEILWYDQKGFLQFHQILTVRKLGNYSTDFHTDKCHVYCMPLQCTEQRLLLFPSNSVISMSTL